MRQSALVGWPDVLTNSSLTTSLQVTSPCYFLINLKMMVNEGHTFSNSWDSFSELNCGAVFDATKKYPCKFGHCKRTFTHSQSRSRHYRQDHTSDTSPVSDPVVNDDAINSMSVGNMYSQNRETPQIQQAMNLCQSLFNREDTDTEKAIAMIKESRMVRENAIEMR